MSTDRASRAGDIPWLRIGDAIPIAAGQRRSLVETKILLALDPVHEGAVTDATLEFRSNQLLHYVYLLSAAL